MATSLCGKHKGLTFSRDPSLPNPLFDFSLTFATTDISSELLDLNMASTNTQPPSHQLTSINFLAFPFDIRCIIYSFIDLSFCEERPDYCLSDDLIACSTGALTGCPLLDCSATMRTEAFAYAVRQSPPVLREDTLLPFTAPACTKMVEYLERTKNFDVFLRNIDDLHFDLRESRNPEALAMLEKCTSLSAITLSIEVDEVDTSAPDIVPQGLMNLLLKLPEMNCVTIEVLDSRDGAMKTLEELGSEDMVRKWQYLERHVDTDLRVRDAEQFRFTMIILTSDAGIGGARGSQRRAAPLGTRQATEVWRIIYI